MDFPEVETVAPVLQFLMDREGVNLEMQTKFYAAGIVNLRPFAASCPSVDELRKSLLKDFGVDPESGIPAKVLISKIVVAWEAARASSTKLAEAEAEMDIRQESKASSGERLQDYEEHLRGKVVEAGEGVGPSKVLHRES